MKRQSVASRLTPFVVLAALVVALALVPAALAGKGGNGGGKPGGSPPSASLTASPNPVAAWGGEYWLRGCGYVVGKQVTIVINGGMFFAMGVDDSGCLMPTNWWAGAPGTDSIKAYQDLKGRWPTLMASTELTVT